MHKLSVGVQSRHIVYDEDPAEGFQMLRQSGFTCCDFSLNAYLSNEELYKYRRND